MLRIRLRKIGKKNQPLYRLVVCEGRSKPQGKYIEGLGFYNSRRKEIQLKKDRILHWLENGAQASVTVHNLLVAQGVIKGAKKKAWYPHPKKEAGKAKARPKKQKQEDKKEEIKPKTAKVDKEGSGQEGEKSKLIDKNPKSK